MSATLLWRVGASPRFRRGRVRGRLGSIGRAIATLRAWRQRSRARAELAALDDRMLRDIGVTRAEAEYLSSKPFWKG
ncbi:MAG TPA: DUF1127 domain-containing protein [Stellaceae bacterium]|nr:DUF1127 domain-containing protein [Stellaceae bacterium]